MKKLVVILAAALLATGIVTAQLWLQLRDARAQDATLQARVTALEATQLAASRLSGLPASAPVPEATPADLKTTDAPRPERTAERTAAAIKGIRELISSPDAQEMRRTRLRMALPQRYPDLGKELRLSPEEENKLFDLLASQQSGQVSDLLNAAGGGTTAQEMQSKAQEKRQANDAELSAMLGSKYPQWQNYQETLPTRQQVNQLQAMLGSGSNSLSDAQAKPLITALAAEKARISQESANSPASNPQEFMAQREQRTADSNRRLLAVAATQLNTEQLNDYKRMLDQEQNTARMLGSFMGRQGRAAGQAGAAAGTPR